MKASERRAVRAALIRERCPACNAMGHVMYTSRVESGGFMRGLCTNCGQNLRVNAYYEQQKIRGGHRTVAALEVQQVVTG